jgi:hypothetical protein
MIPTIIEGKFDLFFYAESTSYAATQALFRVTLDRSELKHEFLSQALARNLAIGVRMTLVYRAVHLFLKSHHGKVCLVAAFVALEQIATVFMKLGRWKDAYDASMLSIQLALVVSEGFVSLKNMVKLLLKMCKKSGWILEATGRFADAGKFYQDCCNLIDSEQEFIKTRPSLIDPNVSQQVLGNLRASIVPNPFMRNH